MEGYKKPCPGFQMWYRHVHIQHYWITMDGLVSLKLESNEFDGVPSNYWVRIAFFLMGSSLKTKQLCHCCQYRSSNLSCSENMTVWQQHSIKSLSVSVNAHKKQKPNEICCFPWGFLLETVSIHLTRWVQYTYSCLSLKQFLIFFFETTSVKPQCPLYHVARINMQ